MAEPDKGLGAYMDRTRASPSPAAAIELTPACVPDLPEVVSVITNDGRNIVVRTVSCFPGSG